MKLGAVDLSSRSSHVLARTELTIQPGAWDISLEHEEIGALQVQSVKKPCKKSKGMASMAHQPLLHFLVPGTSCSGLQVFGIRLATTQEPFRTAKAPTATANPAWAMTLQALQGTAVKPPNPNL